MSCNCNDFTMLPIKGFGVAVDTNSFPQQDLSPIENDLETLKKEIEKLKNSASYFLCEFYHFRNPLLHKGFELAHGGIIEDAATRYPEAWAFLQTDEGKAFCLEEAAWQDMNQAVWHTLADETKVGFDGVGGVPFYVQDLCHGTLRLPDIRGMYAEAAGFDELEVGGVHGDMVRNITGQFIADDSQVANNEYTYELEGVFVKGIDVKGYDLNNTKKGLGAYIVFDPSRVVPVGNANKPRAYGLLPCVYLGNA